MTAKQQLQEIALERCGILLETPLAKLLPRQQIEALLVLAFAQGAAWALDDKKIDEIFQVANAQMQALRSAKQ